MYDVAIVGAGAAGIMAALELSKNKKLSILLVEQVKRLHDSRNVSNGWFGGSAKSDVRLFGNIGFGGDVQTARLFSALITHLTSHMSGKVKKSKSSLTKSDIRSISDMGFTIFEPETLIISADKMIQIENSIQKLLQEKITVNSNCRIEKVEKIRGGFALYSADNKVFQAKKCVLALGRGGADWAANALQSLKIDSESEFYELGVRLEFPERALSHLSSTNFKVAFDRFRTSIFAMNGTTEMENVNDYKTSNVRVVASKPTHNASIFLLKRFDSKTPLKDVLRLVKIANVLSDEQLLREPVSKWLSNTSVLSPVPEYASLSIGINRILTLIPSARKRAIVYAPEARINTIKYHVSKDMESSVTGLYIVGDMSGHTGSFSQAGCSGIAAARHILKIFNDRRK